MRRLWTEGSGPVKSRTGGFEITALVAALSCSACFLFPEETNTDCSPLRATPTSMQGLSADVVTTIDLGFVPSIAAAGDFDDDGTVDLAVADPAGGRVSVLHGDGGHAYSEWHTLPGESGARRVLAADLDLDGIDDLIVAGVGDLNGDVLRDHVRVFFGGADFELANDVPLDTEAGAGGSQDTTSLAVLDLDADGWPDVVTGSADAGGYVFWGGDARTISEGQPYIGSGSAYQMTPAALDPDLPPSFISYGDAFGTGPTGRVNPNIFGADALMRVYAIYDDLPQAAPGETPWTLKPADMPFGQTGIAVVDLDADGYPEPVGAFDQALHLYENDKGRIPAELATFACVVSDDDTTHVTGLTALEITGDMTPELATLEVESHFLAIFAVRMGTVTDPIRMDVNLPGGQELIAKDLGADGMPELIVSDADNEALHIVRFD
jgi:hypothetical protein